MRLIPKSLIVLCCRAVTFIHTFATSHSTCAETVIEGPPPITHRLTLTQSGEDELDLGNYSLLTVVVETTPLAGVGAVMGATIGDIQALPLCAGVIL